MKQPNLPMGYYPAEKEVPVSPEEVYANVMQEERVRNMLAQSSPDNLLNDIQWRIKGYIKDPETKIWKKIDRDAREPSALLVSRFISYLSALLNDNARWSNLSSNEINAIMSLCVEYLVDDLESNQEDYGLTGNFTEMTRVGHIILNSAYIGLKRCLDGQESKRIFKSLNLNDTMGSQKEGVWDKIKKLI